MCLLESQHRVVGKLADGILRLGLLNATHIIGNKPLEVIERHPELVTVSGNDHVARIISVMVESCLIDCDGMHG